MKNPRDYRAVFGTRKVLIITDTKVQVVEIWSHCHHLAKWKDVSYHSLALNLS